MVLVKVNTDKATQVQALDQEIQVVGMVRHLDYTIKGNVTLREVLHLE